MDNHVKGVQCYEPFGGIALKNHAFYIFFTLINTTSIIITDRLLPLVILPLIDYHH